MSRTLASAREGFIAAIALLAQLTEQPLVSDAGSGRPAESSV